MSQHFLDYFFYPRSIAVIGASNNKYTLNFNLFNNLVKHKFSGRIYPVNPNSEYVRGIKAYDSISSIDDDIDLVVTSVPARRTLPVIKECIAKQVKAIVLVSGGFSEIGSEGRKIQDTISAVVKESGIRVIGPNTLSPVNCSNVLVISFHYIEKLLSSSVSFIFQSGMYDPRINWLFGEFRLGINKLIDLGNKMDINEVDALEYLSSDKETKVIAMHLETIRGDSKKFLQVIKEATRKKPVIVMKTGRTGAGARAAASHTGSIITENDDVFDMAMKQSGAIRVYSLQEFLDVAKAFDYLDFTSENRCAIGAMSGGECVLAADMCQKQGLHIAELDEKTQNRLKAIFPPWQIPTNPMDLGVCYQFHGLRKSHEIYLESIADETNVDCMLVQLGMIPLSQPVESMCSPFLKVRRSGKNIVLWVIGNRESNKTVIELESNRIPVYPSLERALRALSAISRYSRIKESSR
jgi:acyl-CoA synthetase (NDP forming)